jgi:hypothetical protein
MLALYFDHRFVLWPIWILTAHENKPLDRILPRDSRQSCQAAWVERTHSRFQTRCNCVHQESGIQSFLELLGAPPRVHVRPTPSDDILPSGGVTSGVTQFNGIPQLNGIIVIPPSFESLSRHRSRLYSSPLRVAAPMQREK